MIKPQDKIAICYADKHISYNEMLCSSYYFASLSPKEKGAKTIILSENSPTWAYSLLGIWSTGGIAVPVDATSTPSDIAYIIDDCQPACMMVSESKIGLAKEALSLASNKPTIININEVEASLPPYDDTLPKAEIKYDSSDISLIVYTSGTTGSPKGVMLTFGNIMANIHAVSVEVPIFTPSICTLVLLPLHHILPLLGSLVAPLVTGGSIAFAPSLSANDLMQTLQNNGVGIIIGVPRLYTTLFKGIHDKIFSNKVTKALYHMCEHMQWRWLSRLIFRTVRVKMGGKIKYLVSGGAALDRDVAKGLKTIGLDVLEGYGMTEAAPMIAFTRPNDIVPGASGQPMPSVNVEIRDEEIFAKGPGIMKGYYNRPEETAAVLDSEGWLRTGDLGHIDKCGRLIITGRRKEIIVLSNGKNINPVEIEQKIENYTDHIKECGVIAKDDLLHAIIVPNDNLQNLSDIDIAEHIKWNVIEPYNNLVAPYKKLMSFTIYRKELPRTKLDKLQRYRLIDILKENEKSNQREEDNKERNDQNDITSKEFSIIKQYIEEEKHCKVNPDNHIEMDLAFDSLDKVGLQAFLQNSFGVDMTTEQISSFRSVKEMSEWVAQSKTKMEIEKVDWAHILRQHSKVRLPDTWATGQVFLTLTKPLFKLYFKLTGTGTDNIPDGPVIIAPNHQSFLDGLFVMSFMKLRSIKNTYFYAKEQHVRRPILKFIARHHNVIVLDMNNIKESIMKLGEALKKKKNIIIFPEGTRTIDGKLGEFKKTFAILSKELGVPVVPVSIKGAFEAMPKGAIFPRPKRIQVEFLKPIYPDKYSDSETYESLTKIVRDCVKENQENRKVAS
ncbi:MAG: AMP-binding protein [Marinilabiliaceae bacterium]|nr:AMP-binding protein [Marinilabiliaceae bacterium]